VSKSLLNQINKDIESFFKLAEKKDLTPEERKYFEYNLKYYRDLKNVLDTAYQED